MIQPLNDEGLCPHNPVRGMVQRPVPARTVPPPARAQPRALDPTFRLGRMGTGLVLIILLCSLFVLLTPSSCDPPGRVVQGKRKRPNPRKASAWPTGLASPPTPSSATASSAGALGMASWPDHPGGICGCGRGHGRAWRLELTTDPVERSHGPQQPSPAREGIPRQSI